MLVGLTPAVDANCARQLKVVSRLVEHEGESRVEVQARCLSCKGREIATWAAQLGDSEHVADAVRKFCSPGEYDSTLQA